MIVIPAIDLKDGQCVRLRQGRFDAVTVFNPDPSSQARVWEDAGAARIHVVDLDGSASGSPVNRHAIERIVACVSVPVQLGGGIRDRAGVKGYLDLGIDTVILGTLAAKNIGTATEIVEEYPGKIAVGIDAKNGWVAVEGWQETTTLKATQLAASFSRVKPSHFIYTDIEKDGMMQGPNIESTREFALSTPVPVILSGGVSSLEDVRAVLGLDESGVAGMIIGRALYDGSLDLRAAITLAERERNAS
jgi:phosphoribosylformimino-5-aminoimidazole carboxamide ribotide isomerase